MAYRILSLDGGGPWALIQACVLEDLFNDAPGHDILGRFDLAIANSGGSITLAGLIKNLRPSQIRDLFMTEAQRTKIFVRRNFLMYTLFDKIGLGPKWQAAAKLQGLREIFNAPPPADQTTYAIGDTPITNLPLPTNTQIIVAGFDYDLNREVFFHRNPSRLQTLNPAFVPTLAGAVHASSNAPINYFDAPALVPGISNTATRRFWDGGVGGYNTPVFRGVVEALANNQHLSPSDIYALSLGTGTNWLPAGPPLNGEPAYLFATATGPNPKTDLTKIATAIIDDPPDAATVNAYIVTRSTDEAPRAIRLSPMIAPERAGSGWALPTGFARFPGLTPEQAFKTLLAMPMDAVAQPQVSIIQTLAEQWQQDNIRNQPVLRNDNDGTPIFGHGKYGEAVAAFRSWPLK